MFTGREKELAALQMRYESTSLSTGADVWGKPLSSASSARISVRCTSRPWNRTSRAISKR